MGLRILIPVKPLGEGKSRLAPALDAAGRRALCERFLRRTLELAAPHIRVRRSIGLSLGERWAGAVLRHC